MAIARGAISALVLAMVVGCGSPSDPGGAYELGVLDPAASLTPNPSVVPIGDHRVRVQIVTVASDCSERSETRVTPHDDGGFLVEPFDQEPARCSSRTGRHFMQDVVLTFDGPGPAVVRIRARDLDRTVVEMTHEIEVP